MKQPNNNLSCIPFYDSLEEQDYRKWYAYGEKYPLRVPSDYLLPFFFTTPKVEGLPISNITFYRSCCETPEPLVLGGSFNESFSPAFARGIMGSLLDSMISNGLVIDEDEPDYNEVIYYAKEVVDLNLPRGLYYIDIEFANGWHSYSDIFFVDKRDNLEAENISIEWWNEENVRYDGGYIPYRDAYEGKYFKNQLFLETEIGKPTYNFTEEGEERNGVFFPMKQISDKSYNMGFIAPEYLCDVMRLIRMADVVRITDKLGRVYNVEQFEMDVNWMEQGHYAEVSCTFKTDTIVKKVGKAYTNITDR